MKIEEIGKLIKLLDQSSLTRLTYSTETETLQLSKKKEFPAPAPQAPVIPAAAPAMPAMPTMPAMPAAAPQAAEPAAPAGGEAPAAAAADDSVVEVKSTLVGTISLHEEGSDKPFVTVGAKVKKGQCICQIEAMKMYNSIPSPVAGEVISVDVENGEIVEFGTVIAKIRKEA